MKRDHVKHEFTNSELDFALTTARAKAALGVKTDAQLAAALGMSSSGYANRKASRSIPFERLIPVCHERGINLHHVFFGASVGAEQDAEAIPGTALPLDQLLLGKIVGSLCAAQRVSETREFKIAESDVVVGMMAAEIYDQAVSLFPEGKTRNDFIDAQIQLMTSIMKLKSGTATS